MRIGCHLLRDIRDLFREALSIFGGNRSIELFFHLWTGRVVQEEMRHHGQAPTRNLYPRSMTKEGDGRPSVDLSPANQFGGHLQHNGGNIAPRKGIRLMEKSVASIALVLIESRHKCAKSGICRK